jgi:hypothetical protein
MLPHLLLQQVWLRKLLPPPHGKRTLAFDDSRLDPGDGIVNGDMLEEPEHPPSILRQRGVVSAIPLNIAYELGLPVVAVRLWDLAMLGA